MKNATSLLPLLLSLLAHGCSSENTSFICSDGSRLTAGIASSLVLAAICEDDPPKQSIAHQQTTTIGFEDCRQPFAKVTILDDEELQKQFEHCRSTNDASQWVWVCIAAHRQIPEAQDQIGQYYFWGYKPVEQDYVQAYKWSSLAGQNRQTSYSAYLEMMRQHVTQQQIADAQRLAKDWQPHEVECNPAEPYSDG